MNWYNGTHEDDVRKLDCSVVTSGSSQVVWIYGLGGDLDISQNEDFRYADIRVNDVVNPDAAYETAASTWMLETIR